VPTPRSATQPAHHRGERAASGHLGDRRIQPIPAGVHRQHRSLAPASLVHADLEAQLSARLTAGPATAQQLWWVARLAAAGDCWGLAPALATVARDTR
jgi:hypothetical protein